MAASQIDWSSSQIDPDYDPEKGLVILYRDCAANNEEELGWKEEWSGRFPHRDLAADFKGTVQPALKEYFTRTCADLVARCPKAIWGLLQEARSDKWAFLLANSYQVMRALECPDELIGECERKIDLESIEPPEDILERFADHMAHLVFEETQADRHNGGWAVVSAASRFKPFGGFCNYGS